SPGHRLRRARSGHHVERDTGRTATGSGTAAGRVHARRVRPVLVAAPSVSHPVEVTDPADPRLADFRDLTDADVRPDRRGVVIAEGANVVERLVTSPYPVRAVFGVPARIDALRPVLEPLDVPVFVADKWLLSEVVGFRVTRGVLAAAARPAPP